MRICAGLLCDNAADLWWHGAAWCGDCADKEFGRVPMFIAALELRDPPSTRPDGAGRPTRPHDREAGVTDTLSSAPAPGPSSLEDFEWIIENDGWRETEWELLAGPGWVVPDTERFLKAHLNEGMEP